MTSPLFSLINIIRNFDNNIGTEELGHLEMICAIVHQLTKDLTIDEIKKQGFEDYYVEHTLGVYPIDTSGIPFSAGAFQSKGDTITDLVEDMAAEAAIMQRQQSRKSPVIPYV